MKLCRQVGSFKLDNPKPKGLCHCRLSARPRKKKNEISYPFAFQNLKVSTISLYL